MNVKKRVHSFSIELKERDALHQLEISIDGSSSIFLEGYLGEIERIAILDGLVLEIRGAQGILRLDITEAKIKEIFHFDNTDTGK
ncbi:MAG: hypothetical protein ACFFED_07105 [Candidatus Thorarchaeota archaeon]